MEITSKQKIKGEIYLVKVNNFNVSFVQFTRSTLNSNHLSHGLGRRVRKNKTKEPLDVSSLE